ncbi:metallophosphoesterase [Salicibibacter halophilus]|uniref:Phosphoesterase n=1 Tax=Salicibibacter halophilus TaxID=2502791 RepID=A0A514LGU8_9BACI|nr:metallophosphoesterase [Salicibibacter halophilus]QDI91070.1 metallophosphoesterase [Salicibibacter halophilus]
MQWLVVSDTHGDREGLKKLRERHAQHVEAMFHCGDSELDKQDPLLESFYVVSGNTDAPGEFPEHEVPAIGGIDVWLTHGHLYQVKSTNQLLQQTALEKGACLVFHGHSHHAGAYEKDGITYVNPGSLTLPKKPTEPTYALVTIDYGEVQAVHFYEKDSGNEMKDLSFMK